MVGALPVFLATYHSACPSAALGTVLVPAASSSARPRPAGDVDGDDGCSTDAGGHGEDDVNPCEGRGGLYIRDAGLVDNGLRNYVVGHPGDAHGELAVDGTARPRENEGRFSRQVTRRSECSGSTAARRYGWNR